jgi:hypothetical protein
MMKQAHHQASRYCSPATHVTMTRAYTQGGEDPDGGLCLHPSSGQGSRLSASHAGGQTVAAMAKAPSTSPPHTADGVEKKYHHLVEIHPIAAMHLFVGVLKSPPIHPPT